MRPLMVWGGGWGVLGLRCFSVFGLPGVSVGVMLLRGGSGDGAAPTVACQQWRANSSVQPRCPVQRRPKPFQPVVGAAVPATVTIDTLPATPATLCLPAGMAVRRRCVMSELGSASIPPHRQPTDNVTSHIGRWTRITWHVCFTFFFYLREELDRRYLDGGVSHCRRLRQYRCRFATAVFCAGESDAATGDS